MADVISGKVQESETVTRERKDGKGTFEVTSLKVSGVSYKGFTNTLKKVPKVGDDIEITFQAVKNGKFTNNNIVSVKILDSEVSEDVVKHKETPNFLDITKIPSSKSDALTVVPKLIPNKDISMEVSGLLQSLIASHGTPIDSDKLEEELRQVIRIKRKVALDLEEKGKV